MYVCRPGMVPLVLAHARVLVHAPGSGPEAGPPPIRPEPPTGAGPV